ncbi:MAG: Fur family transcriptional regulator [Bacillota bacterium]
MSDLMARYKNILAENQYKLTSQRKAILKVLIQNKDKHFSAEELYEEVKKINPEMGLATVYRNLELFCRLDITHMLEFDSNFKHYELVFSEDHHHHLICVNCNKIIEFNDDDLISFENRLAREYNFEMKDHYIKFYGYCEDCQNKKERE